MTSHHTASDLASIAPESADESIVVIGATIGIRALARGVSGVVNEVAASGLPVVVTKHGRPIAAIVPIGDH